MAIRKDAVKGLKLTEKEKTEVKRVEGEIDKVIKRDYETGRKIHVFFQGERIHKRIENAILQIYKEAGWNISLKEDFDSPDQRDHGTVFVLK